MSNYAAVVGPLAISGSRKSDGTPNDSGVVYFFQLGTTTTVQVYSDAAATQVVSQPVTLDEGGRINASDFPDGLFITQPVRILIQDSATPAVTVSDTDYIPSTAGATGLSNTGFTSATVDAALTKAFTSFGGQDFKFKAANGATARLVKAKVLESGISPEDFGAVGDGVAIDTTAVQAAFSYITAQGSGLIRLKGPYKIDQAVTLSNTDGVSVVGDGMAASYFICTNATANCLTFDNCDNLHLEGFDITHSSTSTGRAISLTDCIRPVLTRVGTDGVLGDGDFRYGVYADGCTGLMMDNSRAFAIQADAAARGVYLDDCPGTRMLGATGSALAGYGVEVTGSTYIWSFGSVLGTIRYAVALTGTGFRYFGGSVTAHSVATATDPGIRNYGDGVDGYTVNVTSGGTATPDRLQGNTIRIRATTTGAAITIAAPTPAPLATDRGVTMVLDIFNNAGGAMSNAYTMNAVYHLGTVPNQTDLNHNVYLLAWDPDSSVWRQVSYTATT